MAAYVTPTEVRNNSTYDRITSISPTDAVLQKYIDVSTQNIDAYLGGSAFLTSYTEKRRCVLDHRSGGLHVQLLHAPIVTLTSVSVETYPGTSVDLDVTSIRIGQEAGYLEIFGMNYTTISTCINTNWTDGQIIPVATVVYTAGFSVAPDDFKLAASKYAEMLYRSDLGEGGELKSFRLSEQYEVYDTSERATAQKDKLGLSNMATIENILRNYRHPKVTFSIEGPRG